jgi:hypothetical protein
MMKAKKLIALIAFAGLGLCAEGALAQGNDQTNQSIEAPPITDENAAPPAEETPSYNEKVTIDNGQEATTGSSDAGIAGQPEKKERLRVYSGKQDGNNVIVDPR